ncbi:MAG TPA: hypothetical protein VF173_11085 [Thermoanaerobaculia bacterium]|nr:hypothetical protein [Thermoanaerobaculia bacterium]
MNTSTILRFAPPLHDTRAGPEAVPTTPQNKPPRRITTYLSTMDHTPTRIFALNPNHKGFGYAVFELPFRLVDWGLTRITGDKHTGAIAKFEKLLIRFRPDAVVLEDAAAPGSRRHPRVRELIKALVNLARERGIAVYTVARTAVLKCFSSPDEPATKESIAKRLAEEFPELSMKLPPHRKAYMSQDERMAIFDALAFAVTHASA